MKVETVSLARNKGFSSG